MTSTAEQPQPLRTIVQAVKGWVERLGWVWVEGQLIELNRRAGSTMVFLTLRDKLAEVSVSVSTTTTVLDSAGPLTEGATVVAHVRPNVYPKNGRLSFACDELRPVGEGQLLAQLEQRKRLLQAEGLFDPARKKRLPFLPHRIGLITGADSAAERDVLSNARRRWPAVDIAVRHVLVQGPQSAEQVMSAVRSLDADPSIDVIVVARGGGSIEDLLPFSDEGLVRVVAACRTPVVSAIGHEPDNPILDLVADVRASTPTDAAKRIVPDVAEERERITQVRLRVDRAVTLWLQRERSALATLRSRPVLTDPTASFDIHRERVATLSARARRAVVHRLTSESATIEQLLARTRAMSPRATLQRGYAILVDAAGHAVTRTVDLTAGDELLAYLSDGRAGLTVADTQPREDADDRPAD